MRAYHIVFALIFAYTLGFLLIHTPAWEFFSYITNLTGILIVGIFLYLGLVDKKKQKEISSLRGAALVYIVAISIAFILLLEDQVSVRFSWVSFVQHRLTPLVMIAEWILNPPTRKLNFSDILKWLIFPILYFVFSMIRGLIDGWYPYNFLDPNLVGYLGVFKYFIGLLIGGILISAVVVLLSNKLRMHK